MSERVYLLVHGVCHGASRSAMDECPVCRRADIYSKHIWSDLSREDDRTTVSHPIYVILKWLEEFAPTWERIDGFWEQRGVVLISLTSTEFVHYRLSWAGRSTHIVVESPDVVSHETLDRYADLCADSFNRDWRMEEW